MARNWRVRAHVGGKVIIYGKPDEMTTTKPKYEVKCMAIEDKAVRKRAEM